MARKTTTRSTRARLTDWLERSERVLNDMTFPPADYARLNNSSRRSAR